MEKDRPTDADTPRRAGRDEARAVADLWLRSRKASVPANPATIHDDDEVREHFETVVLPEQEVWVIDRDGLGIVGMMALKVGSVEDLHVDPDWTGRGLGSVLIDLAKERCPAGLELWTFQSNTGARRFYERHGFTVVAMTDDENEEKAPDLLYRWSP